MPEISAGIMAFRRAAGLEVLLGHPGGPFWRKKDDGAWTIPKGAIEAGEDAVTAARREFEEETGFPPTAAALLPLGDFRQRSGKVITAFAAEMDLDPASLRSNSFEMEWPPHSGRRQNFPEIDRAAWFAPESARTKLITGQLPILEALLAQL